VTQNFQTPDFKQNAICKRTIFQTCSSFKSILNSCF